MKWWLGAGLLLLAALIIQSGLLAYAMYVLLAVMLVSRLLARSWVLNVHATRAFLEPTAEIGDDVRVIVRVKNSGFLPVPWILLEDLLPAPALSQRPPRLKVKGKRIQLKLLRPGAELTVKYHLTCLMRGYHQVGPLLLESGDLFGLHRRYRIDAAPSYLLVYPRVVGLEGYDLASRRPIGDVQLVHRLFEDPTRNAGVRPYQPGDPLNRVHWGATARTGVLHSKIYEPSTLAGATFVLDFHRQSYPKRGEPHRSELAVTTTISLANAVFELGQQIGLVTNGQDAAERIRVEGWDKEYRTRTGARRQTQMLKESDRLEPMIVETRRGAEQFQRIRETLARLELSEGLTVAELLLESSNRLPRDATVVCVMAEALEETAFSLGNLRRSGFAVSVILIWPDESTLEKSYGRLLSEGVRDIRILKSEAELPDLCNQQVGRATPYQLEMR
jgi:uncharacterized protein (DUF58 family)